MWWFVSVIPPLESQRQTDHWPASQASLLSLSQKGAWTVMKNGNGTLSYLLASTHSDLHTHVHLHMWTHAHTHAHTPTLGHTLLHHDLCNLSVLTVIHSLPVRRASLISCHPHPHRDETTRRDCSRGRRVVLRGGSQSVLCFSSEMFPHLEILAGGHGTMVAKQ